MARHARKRHRNIRGSVRRACAWLLTASTLIPWGIMSHDWYEREASPPAPAYVNVTATDTGEPVVTYGLATVTETVPHATIRVEDPLLPLGVEKTRVKGVDGMAETLRLITYHDGTETDSRPLTRHVITPTVDETIVVGTAVTVPVGAMQQWTHDHMLENGYTEADWTAAQQLIARESGWNPYDRNPVSGAYGLPQAVPGNVMARFGADWETNYQTQILWFLDYCQTRYGGVQQAWAYWQTHHWY